jgi:hypothetical protein
MKRFAVASVLLGILFPLLLRAQEAIDPRPFIELMQRHQAAVSAGKETPLDEFKFKADVQMMLCETSSQTSLAKRMNGTDNANKDAEDCATESRAALKPVFAPALATVKNRQAATLLKDYYAAFLAYTDGLSIGLGERAPAYAERQAAAKQHCRELWSRFAIEADL